MRSTHLRSLLDHQSNDSKIQILINSEAFLNELEFNLILMALHMHKKTS
jgi:hypothetical protein